MYKYHNQNPLELLTDDCTVRAISMAEDTTWDNTYDKLSDLAQQYGTLLNDRNFIISYLDNNYYRLPINNMTVGEVAGRFRDNILLITMRSHITVSKFGTIYDLFDCRDTPVEHVWVVK
jgi:hypothetical protein